MTDNQFKKPFEEIERMAAQGDVNAALYLKNKKLDEDQSCKEQLNKDYGAIAKITRPPRQADMTDYREAASLIPCDVHTFRAVCLIESVGHGFDQDGFPIIAVEPALVWKHASISERRILARDNLADPIRGAIPYGNFGEQKSRFDAIAKSTSLKLAIMGTMFGLTNLPGALFKECGYTSPEKFYQSMCIDERHHLFATAILMRNTPVAFSMKSCDLMGIVKYLLGGSAFKAAQLRAVRSKFMMSYKQEETKVSFVSEQPPGMTAKYQIPTGQTMYVSLSVPDAVETAKLRAKFDLFIPGETTRFARLRRLTYLW